MQGIYFFIDGSALTAQIRQLRRSDPEFRGRKLCPRRFINHLISALPELHGGEYKRITFYFPKGDETAIEDYLAMPDHRRPGEVRDLHFKFCGHKLKKSTEFEKFVEENVPAKFQDRFAKSEKGIDIEMCCDGLKLASAGRIERLFLFSNDGDFIPFCRTLKELGANISIIHLSGTVAANGDLLQEADSYDVIAPKALQKVFLPRPDPAPEPVATVTEDGLATEEAVTTPVEDAVISEKPEAAPSDLEVSDEAPQAGK